MFFKRAPVYGVLLVFVGHERHELLLTENAVAVRVVPSDDDFDEFRLLVQSLVVEPLYRQA